MPSGYLRTVEVAAALTKAGYARTPGAVRKQCLLGKLAGAMCEGGVWWVPVEFAEPGAYRAAVGAPGRKRKEQGNGT